MKTLLLSLLMTSMAFAADTQVQDIAVKDIDGKETTLKAYAVSYTHL